MKIYELLSCRDRWTQRAAARNKDGGRISYNSPEAVCFCLYGAIMVCYPGNGEAYDIRDKLLSSIGNEPIMCWNDKEGRMYEEVVGLARDLDI